MLISARESGGRAFAVVVWIAGLATVVVMTALLLFAWAPPGDRNWLALAEIVGPYFVMMGIIGGASYASNAAERLPGVRKFEGQYRGHGQSKRKEDAP